MTLNQFGIAGNQPANPYKMSWGTYYVKGPGDHPQHSPLDDCSVSSLLGLTCRYNALYIYAVPVL